MKRSSFAAALGLGLLLTTSTLPAAPVLVLPSQIFQAVNDPENSAPTLDLLQIMLGTDFTDSNAQGSDWAYTHLSPYFTAANAPRNHGGTSVKIALQICFNSGFSSSPLINTQLDTGSQNTLPGFVSHITTTLSSPNHDLPPLEILRNGGGGSIVLGK